MKAVLRLGTRGSKLAMAQATATQARLGSLHPDLSVTLTVISTHGDRQAEMPLSAGEGMGLFTKEIQDALLRGEIDAAVHSLKDLPTREAAGLQLAAVSPREDWRDAWISPLGISVFELPAGARVGTGSPRRIAQLRRLRPDLEYVGLRGNVDTRLAKIDRDEVQAAVLAAAGLSRLGLSSRALSFFSAEEMLPAPGQGFLAYECRADDAASAAWLRSLNDTTSHACSLAERSLLDRLGAGCHAPVGALAITEEGRIHLRAFTQNRDGSAFLGEMGGDLSAPAALGIRLAEKLMSEGAELTK